MKFVDKIKIGLNGWKTQKMERKLAQNLSKPSAREYYIWLSIYLLLMSLKKDHINPVMSEIIYLTGSWAPDEDSRGMIYDVLFNPDNKMPFLGDRIKILQEKMDTPTLHLIEVAACYAAMSMVSKSAIREQAMDSEQVVYSIADLAREYLSLTEDEIESMALLSRYEAEIIKGNDETANMIADRVRNIAKKAAINTGIPTTLIYFSGVPGLSSTGITSGLAALGMGTGMLGGVAVLAGITYMIHRTLDQMLPDSQTKRKSMLQTLIENSMLSLQFFVQDRNIIRYGDHDCLMEHLVRANAFWYQQYLLMDIPISLDINKLQEVLSAELEEDLIPEYQAFILSFYRQLGQEDQFILKTLDLNETMQLHRAFKSIRYGNITTEIKTGGKKLIEETMKAYESWQAKRKQSSLK